MTRWIPVGTTLPKIERIITDEYEDVRVTIRGPVLILLADGTMLVGRHITDECISEGRTIYSGWSSYDGEHVDAAWWMQLPAPPVRRDAFSPGGGQA